MRLAVRVVVVLFAALIIDLAWAAVAQTPPADVIGRWDITVQGANGSYPSWLEVRQSGRSTLVGQFVGRVGSARPISRIEFTAGVMRFSIPPQWESGDTDFRFEARVEGTRLSGSMTEPGGNRLSWTAVRAPSLRRTREAVWGKPIPLFNQKDLTGWVPQGGGENQWQVIKGVLTNTRGGANLMTRESFNDFKLHVEFRYPAGGNSGIYLRGRHEVQIEDTRGREPAVDHLGAIYGFIAPNQDAALHPGAWQTFDITLMGRMVTVVLNGKIIISRQQIPGITGGALNSAEGEPGPLLIQGDHGPIEFRAIILTPSTT